MELQELANLSCNDFKGYLNQYFNIKFEPTVTLSAELIEAMEFNNYSPDKSQQPKDVVDEVYDNFKNYVNQITSQSTITPVTNGNNLHGLSIEEMITKRNSNPYLAQAQKEYEQTQREIQRLQNMSSQNMESYNPSSGNYNLSGSSTNSGSSGNSQDGDDDFTPTYELARPVE